MADLSDMSVSDVHDCDADNEFDHCIDQGFCRYSEHARQLRRYYRSGCDPAEAPDE